MSPGIGKCPLGSKKNHARLKTTMLKDSRKSIRSALIEQTGKPSLQKTMPIRRYKSITHSFILAFISNHCMPTISSWGLYRMLELPGPAPENS